MTKLADIADKKSEAHMLELLNRVTLDVIIKVRPLIKKQQKKMQFI